MQLKDLSVTLPHKPTATLRISALFPGTSSPEFADSPDIAALPPSSTLLVFLNGLILPRSSWNECISRFLRVRDKHRRCSSSSNSSASSSDTGSGSGSKTEPRTGTGNANGSGPTPKSEDDDGLAGLEIPNILTYDRFGQGESDPYPSDPDPEIDDTPYGHTPLDVIADLHQLLHLISSQYLSRPLEVSSLNLIFIANSIGCPLARLYNYHHPQVRVTGYLFLDSMMANSDFVSVFPDPDSPAFDPETDLKGGVSEEDLRWTRQKFREKFHPSVGNTERLDRRGLRTLLPWTDRPKLTIPPLRDGEAKGMEGKEEQEQEGEQKQEQAKMREGTTTTEKIEVTRPRVIVIGHDWDVFADQNEKGPMSIPKAVINGYMNPAWQRYNEGLTHLAAVESDDDENVVPVKIAKDCGHFIQKDDPELVARELDSLLRGLGL